MTDKTKSISCLFSENSNFWGSPYFQRNAGGSSDLFFQVIVNPVEASKITITADDKKSWFFKMREDWLAWRSMSFQKDPENLLMETGSNPEEIRGWFLKTTSELGQPPKPSAYFILGNGGAFFQNALSLFLNSNVPLEDREGIGRLMVFWGKAADLAFPEEELKKYPVRQLIPMLSIALIMDTFTVFGNHPDFHKSIENIPDFIEKNQISTPLLSRTIKVYREALRSENMPYTRDDIMGFIDLPFQSFEQVSRNGVSFACFVLGLLPFINDVDLKFSFASTHYTEVYNLLDKWEAMDEQKNNGNSPRIPINSLMLLMKSGAVSVEEFWCAAIERCVKKGWYGPNSVQEFEYMKREAKLADNHFNYLIGSCFSELSDTDEESIVMNKFKRLCVLNLEAAKVAFKKHMDQKQKKAIIDGWCPEEELERCEKYKAILDYHLDLKLQQEHLKTVAGHIKPASSPTFKPPGFRRT